MIGFCVDLDNTLIYSYRHDIGNEKVLVETMDGKELSFMTPAAFETLQKISQRKQVIPVTTRSLHQYRRIDFGKEVKISYALVANGGILLEDGVVNKIWTEDTKMLVGYAQEEMAKGMEYLQGDTNVSFEIRKVDELFIFTKSDAPEYTVARLKSLLNEDIVYIDSNGEKIYIFPKSLNKGASVERLKKHLALTKIIAAGDSDFDVPMLNFADVGICPKGLAGIGDNVISLEREVFAQGLLDLVFAFEG